MDHGYGHDDCNQQYIATVACVLGGGRVTMTMTMLTSAGGVSGPAAVAVRVAGASSSVCAASGGALNDGSAEASSFDVGIGVRRGRREELEEYVVWRAASVEDTQQ